MGNLTYTANSIEPLHNRILVKDMVFSERLSTGGIILPSDDRLAAGIRPRWAEICFIGPDQTDVKVGEWVLVEHGRWSRGFKMEIAGEEMVVRMVDETAILLVSDTAHTDETASSAVSAISDVHRVEGSLHRDGTQSDF